MASPAWEAWRAGDFGRARAEAEIAVQRGGNIDEASHLLALAAHATGDHTGAIAACARLDSRYRRLAELNEPVFWSYVRLGDMNAAFAFARQCGMNKNRVTRRRLKLAAEKPLGVSMAGVTELPFTSDAFSAVMPGVQARLNGHPVVVRLDTGASFIHLTRSQAKALGIQYSGWERQFAALAMGKISHGAADLELGEARLCNVPVAIHADHAFPAGVIASHFGVKLGPFIGTSVFERFLATIDSPGRRLILSARGDSAARDAHQKRLPRRQPTEAPFALLDSHFMIARGRLGAGRDLNLFIDSGLAAFTSEQGQAAVLASSSNLRDWRVPAPAQGRFAAIPEPVALASARRDGLTAFEVPDRAWRAFGDWHGVRVDALLSHGFLKHFVWTLDFDRMVYLFHDPIESATG